MRKIFFTQRWVSTWNTRLERVEEAESLTVFKKCPDTHITKVKDQVLGMGLKQMGATRQH